MSKKYIVAIIFKNGMKLCSKPLSRGRAKDIYDMKGHAFKCLTSNDKKSTMEFQDAIFNVEDIFMITMVEEQKND